MEKVFPKSLIALFLSVCGLLVMTAPASAEIEGKYFAADLEGADLLGIVSNHPVSFLTVLDILVVAFAGYCFYKFAKRKKETIQP